MGALMSGITPCLWFDGRVAEAAQYYASVFDDTVIERLDDFMTIVVVGGQRLQLLNGGPVFPPTPAFSLVYGCPDQAELDRVWDRLVADGGEEGQCGWCVDRYGVSWQIIPAEIESLLSAGQPVMDALMQMQRIDIAALIAAGATGAMANDEDQRTTGGASDGNL